MRFDSGPEVFVRVNRNYVLTEYVLNENNCSDIISCPIFKTKVSVFGFWRDLSNNTLFAEISWEKVTQWLSKLYRSLAIDLWLDGLYIIRVGIYSPRSLIKDFFTLFPISPTPTVAIIPSLRKIKNHTLYRVIKPGVEYSLGHTEWTHTHTHTHTHTRTLLFFLL